MGPDRRVPEILGPLVGPGAAPVSSTLRFYGTDLGWTFEHRGQLLQLFGDTWPVADSLCGAPPLNDDSQATLPLTPPGGVPPVTFVTPAGAPDDLAPIRVQRGTQSLSMGYGQVPIAGFSDGTDAFALFGRGDFVRCTRRSARRPPSCRPYEHLTCTQDVGECTPTLVGVLAICDLATGAGCLPGQTCTPSATGFCVDPSSSQNDGTPASLRFTVAHLNEIAAQDTAQPASYQSVATLATNKFINATVRTVARFKGRLCGNDYGPGHGSLLMWGRAGFNAEQGRQAQLYLLAQRLPLPRRRKGPARLRARYFAGVDARTGQPRWSKRESQAAPIALDGVVGGSPLEEQPIVDQMAISWLGPPVSKWVMLYGGDLTDYLLLDPAHARPGDAPGAIRIRFADHPWGPWTPPEPHLRPGNPAVVGDPYGPGGVLFHVACQDAGAARCAPSDPTRPPDAFLPGCPSVGRTLDNGRLYGPNIIDAYTRADGSGSLDVFWNVSTWNPYGVVLVRTNVRAASASAATTCRNR